MAFDEPHGAGGIPRDGRAEAYATQLWLEGPSAFWLHPEGPLSDTTPEQWRAKQTKKAAQRVDIQAQNARYLSQIAQQQAFGMLQSAQTYGGGIGLQNALSPSALTMFGLRGFNGLF